MTGVFDGIRVADFTQGMAGPMATMVLADNGAEVVKVEPEGGDWARPLPGFRMWNRGKRSVVIDLHQDGGRQRAHQLVQASDVVVESFRPGRAAVFGLDAASIRRLKPTAVACSLTGFGPLMDLNELQSYEAIVTAKSGRMVGLDALSGAVVPDASSRPVFLASPVSAFGSAMLAVQGIASQLLARERSGLGSHIETSLLDGVSAATMRLRLQRSGDSLVVRHDDEDALIHRGVMLTFLTAECKDGRYIQMCARQDHHFRNWLLAVGLDHLLEDERFTSVPMGFQSIADIEEMESLLRERMLERTQAEWMKIFIEDVDVGADPFLQPAEFLDHPQMIENDRVVSIEEPEVGAVKQVGKLVEFSRTPSIIGVRSPGLGEHQDLPHAPNAFAPLTSVAGDQTSRKLPLEGVTILESAYFLAAPFASTLLAEQGARVIKLEPMAGDPWRRVGVQFVQYIKGKESICVDLKTDRGREILHRLVAQADAFMHNFRPGVAERLHMDYDSLRAVRPDLVYLYAGSYGSRGPESHRAAFHSTPNALCGGGVIQAGQGNAPVDDSYPDPCAALGAAAALAMGLLARDRHGIGQYLETTMLASSGYVHSNHLTLLPEVETPTVDHYQYGFDALYRLYPCEQGWLFVSAVRDQEWLALTEALGRQSWATDARFVDRRARLGNDTALAEELAGILTTDSARSWERILTSLGVPVAEADGPSFEEFFMTEGLLRPGSHPQFGEYFLLPQRIRVTGVEARDMEPSAAGEHTEALLDEIGYADHERQELVRAGVVRFA